jgi:hypothetical protein
MQKNAFQEGFNDGYVKKLLSSSDLIHFESADIIAQ